MKICFDKFESGEQTECTVQSNYLILLSNLGLFLLCNSSDFLTKKKKMNLIKKDGLCKGRNKTVINIELRLLFLNKTIS